MEQTIANTQERLAAENAERRAQAYKNYMQARASPKQNSIANTIAKTKARLAAENTERRTQAHVNYMKARASSQPNSIANTIAKTKAKLANEEQRRRKYWDEVKIKKNKQWAKSNEWHRNNPTEYALEGCEERGRVVYTTKKFDSFSGKMEELQECLSQEQAAEKNAIKQAKQNKISSIGSASSSASSRSSSPVASGASSPVASGASSPVAYNSDGSMTPITPGGNPMTSWEAGLAAQRRANSMTRRQSITRPPNARSNTSSPSTPTSPTLSVSELRKRFQKGGDAMTNWTARLAAQRRINNTRRAPITPIRIPNVKFNTSSPSTPTSPSSPMSVKNRIKFFENKRKSVGGKTRKNKNRKNKTKKSRRN